MLNVEAANLHKADTAEDVTLTLPAISNKRWSIGGLLWSLEGAEVTTTAILSVFLIDTASTNLIWQIDVGDSAPNTTSLPLPGQLILSEPVKFPPSRAVVFELVAATAVVGKLNILGAKAL